MPHFQEYETKNGEKRYRFFVEMGKDPATGERKRLTKLFKKKNEGWDWVADKIKERKEGFIADPNCYTVKEYLEWFLEDIKYNLSPTTFDGYKMIVNTHLIPALGAVKIDELKPMHIKSYITKKRKSGRKDGQEGGLSERTLLHHFLFSGDCKYNSPWITFSILLSFAIPFMFRFPCSLYFSSPFLIINQSSLSRYLSILYFPFSPLIIFPSFPLI